MTRIEKLAASVLASVALAFALLAVPGVKAVAQSVGGSIEAAYVHVLNASGLRTWRVRVDSTGNLVIEGLNALLSTDPASGVRGLVVDSTSGGLVIPTYTTAQLATIEPSRTGVVVCDTTLAGGNLHPFCTLKVSSATALASWTLY